MKLVLLGASHSKGISAKNGKPYEIAEIYIGKKPRSWETDKGSCVGFGFGVGEENNGKIKLPKMTFVVSDTIVKQLETSAFPVLAEVQTEPNPENPEQNFITGYTVIKSLFDDLHKK